MTVPNVSIMLILFIFAIAPHAWSDPDKSMNAGANRITTRKVPENKGIVQKKRKAALKPAPSIKKGNSKSQSALPCPGDKAALVSTGSDVDFLKAVEEKRTVRWIDLDQILSSPEFLRSTRNNHFFGSREAPATKSSNTDFDQSISKPIPADSKYLGGRTTLEALKHLESKKEEILREIFMGLRFSFTPISRHVVLEMNVSPSYERGPGLIIPF